MSKDLLSAKNYAYRLIKFRVRSEKEIRDKLKNKEYDPAAIQEVVDFLKKSRLLDDELFARLWVQSRIKKPLGPAKLRYELKLKGIDSDIIENTFRQLQENYSEEKVIEEIIRKKMKKMGNIDAEKAKSRLYGFLLRRGYPRNLVVDGLLKIFKSGTDQESA